MLVDESVVVEEGFLRDVRGSFRGRYRRWPGFHPAPIVSGDEGVVVAEDDSTSLDERQGFFVTEADLAVCVREDLPGCSAKGTCNGGFSGHPLSTPAAV